MSNSLPVLHAGLFGFRIALEYNTDIHKFEYCIQAYKFEKRGLIRDGK